MAERKMSIMCYGDTGIGKTTQFRYFSKYVHEKFKLKSRFICLDTGSLWECVQDYVDEGFVEPVLVPSAPEYNPFAVMRKFARGWWPENGVINPPTRGYFKGNTFVTLKSDEEPPATTPPTPVKWKTNTKWDYWTEENAQQIGLIGTDSLTEYSRAFMFDALVKNVRKGGESKADPREEEGEFSGSNTIGHYGDAQSEIKAYIVSITALPCRFAFFTALADGGTEQVGTVKVPCLGPQIAGSAATGELPKLVTNCFHMTADGQGAQRVVKAWYEEHPDLAIGGKLKWKAKASSLLPEQKRDWIKKNPEGFFTLSLERGIRDFLDFKDMADEKLRALSVVEKVG